MPSPFFNRLGETVHTIFKEANSATFKPKVGTPQPVEVIFNDRHQDLDLDRVPYGSPRPVAWIKTGTISPVYEDEIEINGIDYMITEVQPDGLELTQLNLAEPD